MRKKVTFKTPITLLILFFVFTLCVKLIDVKAIGPEGSEVGFAGINRLFYELIGYRPAYYVCTQIVGYIAISIMIFFFLIGLKQLIQRKSLPKVDQNIMMMGTAYFIMLVFYGLFQLIVVNYRPVIIDLKEGLEASYPSSHTVLAIGTFLLAALQVPYYVKKEKSQVILKSLCLFFVLYMIVGRMISGIHWFTDIIAALILAAAVVTLYMAAEQTFIYNRVNNSCEKENPEDGK